MLRTLVKITTAFVLVFGTSLLFSSNALMAAKQDKFTICHYDADSAMWHPITINGNALEAHMANHDDAFPEQVTGISGTWLDENCESTGLPPCGNCLVSHGGPGCECGECEAEVCAIDPYCCGEYGGWWDEWCATEAVQYCQGILCQ